MKGEQFEGRLLSVLIIFVISIGILHGRKGVKIEVQPLDIGSSIAEFSPLSFDQVFDYLHKVIISRNLPLVGRIIAQFPDKLAKNLAQKIIESKKFSLTPQESLQFLFTLTYYFSEKKGMQFDLFNLLAHYSAMEEEPVLLLLARSPYHDVIPEFIQWVKMQVNSTNNKELVEKYITRPLRYAVDDNDLASLELLVTKKLRMTPQQATRLLWYAIDKNKNTYFVPFLIQCGANVNYVDEQGTSLLVCAIKQNNEAMVRALLEAGALVNLDNNPILDTALQIAVSDGKNGIISLLREYSSS